MLNLVILLLILVALTLHRYLSIFWENKTLPYSMGFSIFATGLIFLYSINFIWMFGWLIGIILALLTLFQVVNSTFLWPFLVPTLMKRRKNNDFLKVNMTKYATWSAIIPVVAILTVINFFISDYKSLWINIKPFINENSFLIIAIILAILIISHTVRILSMKRIIKQDNLSI